MLFVAVGKVRIEALRDGRPAAAAGGARALAEYAVPGSNRFYGIYQAESLSSLSKFLRSHAALDLESVQPVLHLENLLILEEAPPADPAPPKDETGL